MHIGIDLGTTFSCVAFIDDDGTPKVISNSDGMETTPSVIWFDGKTAYVGKKANDRKITPTSPIYEFVKRDIGKGKQINPRYDINGRYFGPTGLSAIILRKLKKEALLILKKKGMVAQTSDEKNTIIPAIITVPAYFGDLQRQETRKAGFSAGLDVIAIINEPTAAALAYGRILQEDKKILVFDLGGGTFDVTILKFLNGEGIVIASDGADQLGGKNWDELIMDFIYTKYQKITGKQIPDDMGWEVQQKAIQAKFDLTSNQESIVLITCDSNDVEIVLHRSDIAQSGSIGSMYDFSVDVELPFIFEERSTNLLALCKAICYRVLEKAALTWGDIDEIVLAGGSCRMPMIPKMLEDLSGQKVSRNIPGFNYDTAIAIGAAIYGSHRSKVKDVASKTIGIEVKVNGRPYIDHLIHKNTPLPVFIERIFHAQQNAVLKVFEGESNQPDECILRGRLQLGNPEGKVKVTMHINEDGMLSVNAEFPPNVNKEIQIKTDDTDSDIIDLHEIVMKIDIRM